MLSEIQVKKSKKSTNHIITIFSEIKKYDNLQAVVSSKLKNIYINKLNEVDKVIIWF